MDNVHPINRGAKVIPFAPHKSPANRTWQIEDALTEIVTSASYTRTSFRHGGVHECDALHGLRAAIRNFEILTGVKL